MNRMYKFRIYPSKRQKEMLDNYLHTCRFLYNQQLENKIIYHMNKGINLSYQNLNSMLLDLKIVYPELKQIHSQVLQNVNNRLIKAFDKFIKEHKGFPRFKSKNRYNSLTYPQLGFKLSNNHLKLSKIGSIFIKLHRLPKGKIKTLTIKRTQTQKWFSIFSYEIKYTKVTHKSKKQVGIDLGIENFATLSSGITIPNQRYLIKSEQRLKLLQRKLSRKVKNSKNRIKSRFKLAKIHEKITNQRNDFHHKTSRYIANNYGIVVIENLNLKGMVKNPYLSKHINDVAWSNFTNMLCYKAEETGCRVVKINPRNTSKKCSNCGNLTYKILSDRIHYCPCGFIGHRDINASYNILDLATAGTAGSNVLGVVSAEMAMNKKQPL